MERKLGFQRNKEEAVWFGCMKAEGLINLDTERKWSCSGSILQAVTRGGGAMLKGWMSLTNPIKSSAVHLQAHAHMFAQFTQKPDKDNPFTQHLHSLSI